MQFLYGDAIRKDAKYDKQYLDGRYGAIPQIEKLRTKKADVTSEVTPAKAFNYFLAFLALVFLGLGISILAASALTAELTFTTGEQ